MQIIYNSLWLCLLLMFSHAIQAKEPQWYVNGNEVALTRIYNTPNGERRWIKTVTRSKLGACLAVYPASERVKTRNINFCLCKLTYGANKCNR